MNKRKACSVDVLGHYTVAERLEGMIASGCTIKPSTASDLFVEPGLYYLWARGDRRPCIICPAVSAALSES